MYPHPQTSTCLHRRDTGGRRKGEKGYGGEEAEFKVRKTIVSEYTTGHQSIRQGVLKKQLYVETFAKLWIIGDIPNFFLTFLYFFFIACNHTYIFQFFRFA